MLRTTGQPVKQQRSVGRLMSGGSSGTGRPGSLGVPGLVLIGVGGIIGAGFFLGAGLPIRTAGPAVLLAFLIGALVMAQVTGALASMAIDDPEPGAFMTYAERYIGVYAGFLEGWTYYIASILTIASESVAMSIFSHLWIRFLPSWALTAVYAAIVIAINAFGVRNFDRVESVMSIMKIGALVGFILCIGILLIHASSGGAAGGLLGSSGAARGRFGTGPGGFFPTGASGLFQSMLVVIFAYAGIGVFATATTEMRNPKDISKAAWITVLGLTVLYIVSILLLLFVLPWQQISTSNSPFVMALQATGIPVLGDVFNLIILIASFSVMAGSVFSANQILHGLGEVHQAPRFVLDRKGQRAPYGALAITTFAVGATILISYLLPANVYNFLISASSFLTFLNWFMILWAFLSWRRHKKRQSGERQAGEEVKRRELGELGRKQRGGLGGVHISSLAFGQPISSILTLVFILFLTGYALLQPDQRLGFYAFAALCILVSICYFVIPGLRNRT